jgi:lipopolysaccharide export system protein LptA
MRRNENRRRAALALAAMLALGHGPAFAEQADRYQPVNIESDSMVADDAKKVATFEGKVVFTQGSLMIRAEKLVVRQDNDGFQYGVATGTPATFRQKQEGQEYVEGEANRIEYDGRVERVEFFNNARLRRDSGDDVRGDYISYDARNERFAVKSSGGAAGNGGERRVRATIMPKKKEPAPAAPSQPPVAPAAGRPQ